LTCFSSIFKPFLRTSRGFSGILGREIKFKNVIQFKNCDISYIFLHISLEYSSKMYGFFPQKAMGYGMKIPANQLGILKILWVIIEYGLRGVWAKRVSTV